MIPFIKYQGAGNDFIIIDGRENIPSPLNVKQLCDRRFGIGADGLMLLTNEPGFDFKMVYYNSDGNLSSMCGNGGRCLSHFAHQLGLGKSGQLYFLATDGPHHAVVKDNWVSLEMNDVHLWEKRNENIVILNTGSPHYVHFSDAPIADFDLISFAKQIRYGAEFQQSGINVNVVHMHKDGNIEMRTYERGVEDETLSCGTGVTAAALAAHILKRSSNNPIQIEAPGGKLEVGFDPCENGFEKITLHGPAVPVFSGQIQ